MKYTQKEWEQIFSTGKPKLRIARELNISRQTVYNNYRRMPARVRFLYTVKNKGK